MSQKDQDEPFRGLPPPQFSVLSLLVCMFLLAAVFAAFKYAGPFGGFAAVLTVLTVLGHVLGNALGTRLRKGGQTASDEQPPIVESRQLQASDFAPSTRLRQRRPLGMPVLIATTGGVLAGVLFSIGLFWGNYWPGATAIHLVVAAIAFGVLGGIWTFLGTSFLQVSVGELVSASRESHRS